MTSSVTVWTSPSTTHAQSRVARFISATRRADACYDALSVAGCDAGEATNKLNDAFNRLVTMTTSDSTLHIVAVVPLFEENSAEQIQLLYDACAAINHNITLHILGLASGIRHLFNIGKETSPSSTLQYSAEELLKTLCSRAGFSISYSLIDDYAENGAPIGFSIESLSRYIALIQEALMLDYYQVLSPALLGAHPGGNLSVGVASLSFDRGAVARQLLGLGFIGALDNVGINDKEVDAQKAVHEAETVLAGIADRYPALYNQSIRPLYKDKKLSDGKVAAQASSILDDEIKNLRDDILSVLKDSSLSFPEKEVVLAMILGRDNENIRGKQYQHEGALLDDACETPINLYIDAFNRCCKDSRLLPVRGDFEALKLFSWDETQCVYAASPENDKALNPLADIKRLKQEILNTTSYIRERQDELEGLQKSERQRNDIEEIKNKWRRHKGSLRNIEYKEQPLDEQYKPTPGLKIEAAVDLRKFCPLIGDQQNLGSCTSFATAAMYGIMMNRIGVEGSNDMSSAYLYYYSNVLKGKPEGGSNFFEQLEVLGKNGICQEELYTYDAATPNAKPSDRAEEDARNHRVLSAKQIPLVAWADKPATLRQNHSLLTSALSEGYPVGISLKVFDNLGNDGPFVLHPDDTPDAKEDGWHAMVIVGYSEENQFYIVRNSWGTEFCEDGYCYVPTAYIDDPDFMNFACIITEISDNAQGHTGEIPTVIANFAATETEIRMAAIRNAIATIRVKLKNDQRLYSEYYKYYQSLMMRLTMPNVQDGIRKAAEEARANSLKKTEERKRELEDSFVPRLKEYKKVFLKIIGYLVLGTLVAGTAWYLIRGYLDFLMCMVFGVICVLAVSGYTWSVIIKKRKLQKELDLVAVEANAQAERLLETQIRFHVAGMWLNRFHKLSLEIGNVYDRLVSYNGALRAWQESYSRKIAEADRPEGQMFRTLDASPLLHDFFEGNKATILNNIDLIRLFEGYSVNPNNLEADHQRLRDAVLSVIDSLMADFNIANYLLGDEYHFLKPVDLQDEISTLVNVGQPSYRNKAMNATASTRILLCDIMRDRERQWDAKVGLLFPMRPLQLPHHDPTTLILLTIHPQE